MPTVKNLTYDSEELKMGAESRGVVLAIGIEFDPEETRNREGRSDETT